MRQQETRVSYSELEAGWKVQWMPRSAKRGTAGLKGKEEKLPEMRHSIIKT